MTVLQPKGFYSRLFPVPARSLSRSEEEKLIRLGDAMRYNVEREGTLTPRVGYTYFSQFVGHDLTYDPTPLDNFAKPIPARALEKCRRSKAHGVSANKIGAPGMTKQVDPYSRSKKFAGYWPYWA